MLEPYNLTDYLEKTNYEPVEIKIIRTERFDYVTFGVKYLEHSKPWYKFGKSVSRWKTLCYKDGHSQGWDWSAKHFDTKEQAESLVKKLMKKPSKDIVYHGVIQ